MAEDGAWLSEGEQAVWRHLLCVEALLRQRLDADLREAHDLSLGDYAVLVHLSEAHPEGLRMSDLADRLVLSRSGLTRRVDGLVRAGLVTRRACPVDGRGSVAHLTDRGAGRLREAAPTHVAGVRRYLLEPLQSLQGLGAGLDLVEAALAEGDVGPRAGSAGLRGVAQPASGPVTTAPPFSIHPLVPPATDTAR